VKRLLLGFLCSVSTLFSFAQPYGNEWIDYDTDRYYFKFKVTKKGACRIDYNALNFALNEVNPAIPIASIDPRSIQIFAKGEEQYIHIEGQGDGSFDSGEYIELYCEGNNGWLDERLYPNQSQQTNPYYSL
jgi:hypothetical protein